MSMTTISTEMVRTLREETGAGIMDCKRALETTGGNVEQARQLLRQKGLEVAAKKQERAASEGVVEAYIHGGGRIGVLLELNCETDFVARNEDFRKLARELTMQVAALAPRWLRPEDAPPETVQADGLTLEQVRHLSLLTQPYIRDPNRTVGDLITEAVARVRENIRVRRFVRYELGGR